MSRSVILMLLVASSALAADPPVDFSRDVRPILSDTCFSCHGPDEKARKAKLRLDTVEGATTARHGITPVKPGELAGSEVWVRVMSDDPDAVMPPPHANKKLTDAQKETLRRWIEQGAKYSKHWAFEPVKRPKPPAKIWAGTPIDAFLLRRLEQVGLTPQPEADRETLVRRVAFTLTGLPPTVSEVDEFLKDRSPNAYEKMVDRYLASPRYGEEMARHWLDVARYADTHGLHLDNERQMWAYRDWVIRAFNENLPYDRFTVWQVAGDLLPNPTTEQLVATGFNRCNVTTSEGGAIDQEFAYRYAVERTSAVAQAWLGLTAGCAVCHDHKYDPLTAKEFYSLYAFFNSAADPAMDGNINTTPPFLKLPRPEQKAIATAAGKAEAEARVWLTVAAGGTDYTDPSTAKVTPTRKRVRDVLVDDAFPPGSSSRSSSRNSFGWVTDPPVKAASGRRVIHQAHASRCNDSVDFPSHPFTTPHDANVEVAVYVEPLDVPEKITLAFTGGRSVTWTRTEKGLVRDGSNDAPILPGRWAKVRFPAADAGLKAGSRITGLTFSQNGGVVSWDAVTVSGMADPANDTLESFAVWKKAIGNQFPSDLPADAREDDEKLRAYYLAVIARPQSEDLVAARTAWEAARTARVIAEESPAGTFIFRDRATPNPAFVMLRGQYDKPGEKVEPGGLAVLPPIRGVKPGERLTRLDLANWLVDGDHPLTARVTVNRFWQQVFGTGLVRTSFDFGSQGEPPSHPELLDWLASEFVAHKWDVKRLMKTLMMTDAFRRDSRLTPELRANDPANRLLARGPRIRLDAEQIRDNALAVSGLINLQVGGPGVKPYQPANIWEPVGYADSNTRFYLQDHGPALYRRSVYVFLKRTAPPPFLSNFDAPNREQVCTVRERTNTPIQALQLLNDVQFFEAARALAERAIAEGGASPAERIQFLYRTVLGRSPDARELSLVSAAVVKQQSIYSADPEAARKVVESGESIPRRLASDPETAAWTMAANLLLNLDETVTRN